MPLTISSLKDGGKASQAHVRIGDVVLSIDGISAQGMTHLEAQNKIKACTGSLNMTLQRASAAAKSEPVAVQKGEPKEVVKPVPITSPAVSKVTSTTNMAYNKVPRPFGSVSSPKVTSIPSPSSAFTPAHAATSSHASPPPVAAVTPLHSLHPDCMLVPILVLPSVRLHQTLVNLQFMSHGSPQSPACVPSPLRS